jgi:hypothetical protein
MRSSYPQVRPGGVAGDAAGEADDVRWRLAADGAVALPRLPRQLRRALHRPVHGAQHHPVRLHRHGKHARSGHRRLRAVIKAPFGRALSVALFLAFREAVPNGFKKTAPHREPSKSQSRFYIDIPSTRKQASTDSFYPAHNNV